MTSGSEPTELQERWQDAVTRRVRALARTEPLHSAERTKGMRELDLARVDLRALSLRLLDVVIEEMGLGRGAQRRDAAVALADMIAATAPELRESGGAVAGMVIDALLNEGQRRQAFSLRYTDWTGTPTARELQWHLLQEVEVVDGSFVLRATTEGINVYTGMLEINVQDAQVAEEAVLHAQVRRGRIQDAVRTAGNARLRSIEYAEHLTRLLRLVERDVTQVRWETDLGAALTRAREHLDERLEVERMLVGEVDGRLDGASDADAPRLAELVEVIRDCQRRHIRLHAQVLGAGGKFLDEQARQVFRRRTALPVPDMEEEVFQRALQAPADPLAAGLALMLRAFVPAHARPLFYLPQLAERLLAPRAVPVLHDAPLETDLEEVESERPFFSDEDDALVSAALDSARGASCTLSTLLSTVRARNGSARAESLLVLTALRAYEPSTHAELGVGSEASDFALDDTGYFGQDLLIGPASAQDSTVGAPRPGVA